jgi:hypothetical protein
VSFFQQPLPVAALRKAGFLMVANPTFNDVVAAVSAMLTAARKAGICAEAAPPVAEAPPPDDAEAARRRDYFERLARPRRDERARRHRCPQGFRTD